VEFAMVNLDRSNPIFSGLLRDYLKINDRALKNYFSLSAFLICAIGSKSLPAVGRDVIRDFWHFSEISTIYLDIPQRIVYKRVNYSCKESFLRCERNPQRTPNSFFAGFFVKSR
jgi:hypothetical protein